MLWIKQNLLVFFYDINDMQFYSQLLSYPQGIIALWFIGVFFTNGMGMPFHTKTGKKIDALNMYTLFLYGSGCQHGIQTTGNQGYGFSFLTH